MRTYPLRLALAIVLFGLTLAFVVAAFVTAVYDLHEGILVWENNTGYTVLAISLGCLFLMVAWRMLPRFNEHALIVPVEEFFPQD